MAEEIKFGSTSNIIRFTLKDKTTGQGKTGLSSSTTGLVISTICNNEATATAYSGSNIESITTLGTYATPTSGKCRFKEVDATNHKGLYEYQFADARFAIASAKKLIVSINDVENVLLDTDYQIILTQFDIYNAVNLGLTALPNVASGSAGAVITSGTGTAQLKTTSGIIDLPAITTNWLTSAGIASTALNGKGDWLTSLGTNPPANWINGASVASDFFTNIKDESATYNLRQLIVMLWEMIMAGKVSGLPTSPAIIRDFADTKNRVTIAFDSNNNRTSFTVNNAP